MKKKQLNGLLLNKKAIANFATKIGGNDQDQQLTYNLYDCRNTNVCETGGVFGRCATGNECENSVYYCTEYQCPMPTLVFPVC